MLVANRTQIPSSPRSKAASTSRSASNRDTVSLQPLFEDEKGEDARPHHAALTKICPNLTEGIPVSRTARLLRVEASAHVSLQVGGEPILERQHESPLAAPGDSVREFQKGLGDR